MAVETPFLQKDFATLVEHMLETVGSGAGGSKALTDTTEGSVVRTLMEAFAREMAVCYQQLDKVYRFAYLETAEGVALDNVVALLGLKRHRAGHVEGTATFSRQQPAPADVPIPAGTLVAGRDTPLFETVERAVLPEDGQEVTVNIRSVEAGGDKVEAEQLSVMPRPIWGIEGVTNRGELMLRRREETDDELRERARNAVHYANLGTVSALKQAVASKGISQASVEENIPGKPGQVEVILGDADISDSLLEQARKEVERVRPAGIPVTVRAATRIWVRITATLELDKDYPSQTKADIEKDIKQELQSYFSSLGVGDKVRWAKVRNILTSPESVVELHTTEGYTFLEPFVREAGEENNVASDHLLTNGDLLPGPMARIALDTETVPVRLSLEPPALDVWVDVIVALSDDKQRTGVEEQVRAVLNNVLEKVKPGEALSYDTLSQDVPVPVSGYTIIHTRDSMVAELRNSGDEDGISDREKAQLRYVTILGGKDEV